MKFKSTKQFVSYLLEENKLDKKIKDIIKETIYSLIDEERIVIDPNDPNKTVPSYGFQPRSIPKNISQKTSDSTYNKIDLYRDKPVSNPRPLNDEAIKIVEFYNRNLRNKFGQLKQTKNDIEQSLLQSEKSYPSLTDKFKGAYEDITFNIFGIYKDVSEVASFLERAFDIYEVSDYYHYIAGNSNQGVEQDSRLKNLIEYGVDITQRRLEALQNFDEKNPSSFSNSTDTQEIKKQIEILEKAKSFFKLFISIAPSINQIFKMREDLRNKIPKNKLFTSPKSNKKPRKRSKIFGKS